MEFEESRTAKAQFRAQAKKKIAALQFGILYCLSHRRNIRV